MDEAGAEVQLPFVSLTSDEAGAEVQVPFVSLASDDIQLGSVVAQPCRTRIHSAMHRGTCAVRVTLKEPWKFHGIVTSLC